MANLDLTKPLQGEVYALLKTDTIHHEGDERSRTHPGHGYPAYTETVTRITTYPDTPEGLEKLKKELEYLMRSSSRSFKVVKMRELEVQRTITIDLK